MTENFSLKKILNSEFLQIEDVQIGQMITFSHGATQDKRWGFKGRGQVTKPLRAQNTLFLLEYC